MNTTKYKSNKARKGRYVYGGTVQDFGTRLGWWERAEFPASPSDVPLVLDVVYHKRPDLLADELYGDASLNWFIMQYNSISDVNEFVTGITITLPTKNRLFRELLTKLK